jgi:hypothetical protein
MNYEKIYYQIVRKAKSESRVKSPDIYYECHHIIPRCIGGSNNKDNLVLLTAREHFICHWLLSRIYTDNKKLIYSFHAMCKQNKSGKRYIPSSRVYAEAKELFNQTYIPWNKGIVGISINPNRGKSMIEIFGLEKSNDINKRKSESLKKTFADPLIKKKMANRKLRSSYNMTDDVKDKISNTLKNKYLTGSIQNGMLGKKHSTNTLEKFKKPKNKITCPYCNKIGGQGNMVRYHLENCKNKKYEK